MENASKVVLTSGLSPPNVFTPTSCSMRAIVHRAVLPAYRESIFTPIVPTWAHSCDELSYVLAFSARLSSRLLRPADFTKEEN
jgi:hypothetical protein